MAGNLGIGLVAEGVETREQVDWLQGRGCEQIQGDGCSEFLAMEGFGEGEDTESMPRAVWCLRILLAS